MKNQRTNSRRLVIDREPIGTKHRETMNDRIDRHAVESKNLLSKMVIAAFSPVGTPRAAGCIRYIHSYAGTGKAMCGRGGETDAR